jgi:hypothetical protein
MDNAEKGLKKLEIVNHWISNCDTKSSLIFAFLGILLTIIFPSSLGEEMVSVFNFKIAKEINFISVKKFFCLLCVIVFLIGVVMTFCYIYFTLKARISPEVYTQSGLKTDSNIFYGSIASKKYELFKKESNNETDSDFTNDINSQIFINSNIATEKFNNYNKSLIWTLITFAFFILFIILN